MLSVYVETSIVSYLTSRPSHDFLTAACQQVTSEWWEEERNKYQLFTSALVIAEARAGDPDAAAKRLSLLQGIPELAITETVRRLSQALVAAGGLPEKAEVDALHIAVAAVHKVDLLLTWNCRHIDNPMTKPMIRVICAKIGFTCPEICTPVEIMEMDQDEI
jgi:hypothetical protein